MQSTITKAPNIKEGVKSAQSIEIGEESELAALRRSESAMWFEEPHDQRPQASEVTTSQVSFEPSGTLYFGTQESKEQDTLSSNVAYGAPQDSPVISGNFLGGLESTFSIISRIGSELNVVGSSVSELFTQNSGGGFNFSTETINQQDLQLRQQVDAKRQEALWVVQKEKDAIQAQTAVRQQTEVHELERIAGPGAASLSTQERNEMSGIGNKNYRSSERSIYSAFLMALERIKKLKQQNKPEIFAPEGKKQQAPGKGRIGRAIGKAANKIMSLFQPKLDGENRKLSGLVG